VGVEKFRFAFRKEMGRSKAKSCGLAVGNPTLAQNARMGHPQWERCVHRVGHPPPIYDDGLPIAEFPGSSCEIA